MKSIDPSRKEGNEHNHIGHSDPKALTVANSILWVEIGKIRIIELITHSLCANKMD